MGLQRIDPTEIQPGDYSKCNSKNHPKNYPEKLPYHAFQRTRQAQLRAASHTRPSLGFGHLAVLADTIAQSCPGRTNSNACSEMFNNSAADCPATDSAIINAEASIPVCHARAGYNPRTRPARSSHRGHGSGAWQRRRISQEMAIQFCDSQVGVEGFAQYLRPQDL